jgi:hypothetical protein
MSAATNEWFVAALLRTLHGFGDTGETRPAYTSGQVFDLDAPPVHDCAIAISVVIPAARRSRAGGVGKKYQTVAAEKFDSTTQMLHTVIPGEVMCSMLWANAFPFVGSQNVSSPGADGESAQGESIV